MISDRDRKFLVSEITRLLGKTENDTYQLIPNEVMAELMVESHVQVLILMKKRSDTYNTMNNESERYK